MIVKSITRHYGTHSKTVVYNKALEFQAPTCRIHATVSCQICFKRGKRSEVSISSLQRTKTAIRDYVACNRFDLFATFTYDPEKVDSFDVEHSKRVMSKWLNNARRKSPSLKYIIVAELHKSGRIHFHALLQNYLGDLTPTRYTSKGRRVYNIHHWNFGWSTAVKIEGSIEDSAKVGSYVGKYITKDMLTPSDKRRYWASKNLNKPEKFYNKHRLLETHPLFVRDVHRLPYLVVVDSILDKSYFYDKVTVDEKLTKKEIEKYESSRH